MALAFRCQTLLRLAAATAARGQQEALDPGARRRCGCCQGAAGGAGIPVPDAAAVGCCNCCQRAAGGAGIPVPDAAAIGCWNCW